VKDISGNVQSKSRAGTGIKVGDKWYNGTVEQLKDVEWKSDVSFKVDDSGSIIEISTTKAAAPQTKRAGGGWDDPKRQEVIVFQSARNAAIDLYKALMSTEAIKLPTKQSDKFDASLALVNEFTIDFHKQAMAIYEGKAIEEVFEK